MRLLFVTHNYPRHAGDVAGSFLHPVARELVRRGVSLQVIAPSDRGDAGGTMLDDVPVRRIRYALSHRETIAYTGTMAGALKSVSGIRAFTGLLEAFRREIQAELRQDPETLVHAHWWVPAGASVPARVRHLITCHGTDVRLLDGALPFRLYGRKVLRRAAVVTTVSRSLADVIERRTGLTIPDTQVQPMPVVRTDRSRSTGGGGVVILGRLSSQKRNDLALAGYARAVQSGLALPLQVVGDGAELESLRQIAERLGIADRVTFTGTVPPDQVPTILARADLMLVTAEREGFGLAAAEALMQGVPVLACSDGGGLLDIVADGCGGRVAEPTPDAIAEELLALAGDAGARDAAWDAGERWRVSLSPQHVADQFLDWYGRVLAA